MKSSESLSGCLTTPQNELRMNYIKLSGNLQEQSSYSWGANDTSQISNLSDNSLAMKLKIKKPWRN